MSSNIISSISPPPPRSAPSKNHPIPLLGTPTACFSSQWLLIVTLCNWQCLFFLSAGAFWEGVALLWYPWPPAQVCFACVVE